MLLTHKKEVVAIIYKTQSAGSMNAPLELEKRGTEKWVFFCVCAVFDLSGCFGFFSLNSKPRREQQK